MFVYNPESFKITQCDAAIGTILAHSPEELRIRQMEVQARFEVQTVEAGKLLYQKFAEGRDVTELSSGAKLLKLMMPGAQTAIAALRQSSEDDLGSKGQRHKWVWHLMSLDADKVALIALAGVLRGIMEGYAGMRSSSVRTVALAIATAVQDELEYERWEADQKAEALADKEQGGKLLERLRKRYPNLDRTVWYKWRRKIELVREERMDNLTALQFGSALLYCVVAANADYVTIGEFAISGGKRELRLSSTQHTQELVTDITAIAEVAHPPLRPMLCPPNPWIYEGDKATGGYIIHRAQLVRAGSTAHTGTLKRPVSQIDLDALNAVQAVPWRINTRLFEVVAAARAENLELPNLPVADTTVVPPTLEDNLWNDMTPKERQAHTRSRREAFDTQASVRGVAIAVRDRMDIAALVKDRPAIWFPHSRDFRGRMYPIPSRGPHPQADDLGKSLLEFANGKPLGETGLYWLCVRAANCAGQDKLQFDDRMAWCWQNLDGILAAARDPLGEGLAFWSAGDDPWQLLATCFELAEAMTADDVGASFVSHLPIALDGSCNGLQHLSAMGLDVVGAEATNLSSHGDRHDIYEDVAVIVRSIVETDAASGKPEALAWHGRVTRKVCKRSVMTTPYGVTDRGIRRQLLNDDLVPTDSDVKKMDLANYLGDCLSTALGQTIRASKGIMAWCQTSATRLAAANLPLDWKTPSGSMVRQAYYEQTERRVMTLAGKLVMFEEQLDGVLIKKKAALAASPNIVHSFDAAHLALTVNGAVAQGITDLAMIHDSYGVHASDTMRFAHILRREFVSIYKQDWLTKIRDDILLYAPHVDLPPVPTRDVFDIEQVMNAPFFFS